MNFPILSSLILLPIIGSLFLLFSKDKNSNTGKYVALFTSFVNFLISIYLWYQFDPTTSDFQFVEDREWLKGFINYKVGIDGISILFIVLTSLITPLCIISVNNTIKDRLRDFLIAILVMESLMIGVFCSLDLVIFYLFFEAGLIPMFLIIGIWGGTRRVYSAFKFFLYTLLGSVLMLIAIISIYWISGTTDITQLYELGIDTKYQNLLWLAFFSSFAVKTPMWPVHTWLPDAHVEAPTAGSVLLAAILLKMAGYGFIRFSLGLFPVASDLFTPLVYALSLIAIVYTSLVALMQEDMKKLIAYSSVAHMGFVTLGIFTITQQGIEGSIVQMISHGLVSAALFLCVGVVYDRMHSRLIATYGGLVSVMPKYSILFMLFTLAALGLPGTSGFIGEFLILMGAFKDNFLVAVIASLGVIFGAAYMLWLYRRVVFGEVKNKELLKMPDLDKSEKFIFIFLILLGVTTFCTYFIVKNKCLFIKNIDPKDIIFKKPNNIAILNAPCGNVIIELYPNISPNAVQRFVTLIRSNAYENIAFHRVIENKLIQAGDLEFGKKGNLDYGKIGTGKSGLGTIKSEIDNNFNYTKGSVGLARTFKNDTEDSQFFIILQDEPLFEGEYTPVGKVIYGLEVLKKIKYGRRSEYILRPDFINWFKMLN